MNYLLMILRLFGPFIAKCSDPSLTKVCDYSLHLLVILFTSTGAPQDADALITTVDKTEHALRLVVCKQKSNLTMF